MKFQYLVYFFFIFHIFGCVSSDSLSSNVCPENENDQSVFGINEVTAKVVPLGYVQGGSDPVPSQFRIDFRACVVDKLKISGVKLSNLPMNILTFEEDVYAEGVDRPKGVGTYVIPIDKQRRKFQRIHRETDGSGCINWTENHSYKSPSQERWIKFERIFENKSGFQTNVSLAVNPWTKQETKLYDLRYHPNTFKQPNDKVSSGYTLHSIDVQSKGLQQCIDRFNLKKTFQFFEKEDEKNKPLIWVEEVNLKAQSVYIEKPEENDNPAHDDYHTKYKICDSHENHGNHGNHSPSCDLLGGFFKTSLQFKVLFLGSNDVGEQSSLNVTRGRFRVSAQFIAEPESGDRTKYRLHREEQIVDANLEKFEDQTSQLSTSEFKIHFPFETSDKQVSMYLKVEDLSGELASFFGVYEISSAGLRELKSRTLVHSEISDVNIGSDCKQDDICKKRALTEHFSSEYYNEVQYNPSLDKESGFSRFELGSDLNRMRFVRVRKDQQVKCESPVRRSALYIGAVCFKDPVTHHDFAEQSFSIYTTLYDNVDDLTAGILREEEEIKTGQRTDKEGCLTFLYSIDHNRYNVQEYYPVKLRFRSDTYGYESTQYVLLNPWTEAFLTYQKATQFVEGKGGEGHIDELDELCKGENCGNARLELSDLVCQDATNSASCEQAKNTTLKELVCTGDSCGSAHKKKEDLGLGLDAFSSKYADAPIVRMNEFRMAMIEPTYQLEPSLNLTMTQNLMLLLRPQVYRTDILSTGNASQSAVLPKGYYILRSILLKNFQERAQKENNVVSLEKTSFNVFDLTGIFKPQPLKLPTQKGPKKFSVNEEDYISHFDSIVYSDNETINSFVNFRWNLLKDHHLLGSRNIVLFQILPTDPDGYQYEDKSSCEIDTEKSDFIPFDEHALKTPYHFGIFFSGEFSSMGPMQYIDDDMDIDSILSSKRPTKEELKEDPSLRFSLVNAGESARNLKRRVDYYDTQNQNGLRKSTEQAFINRLLDTSREPDYCEKNINKIEDKNSLLNSGIGSQWMQKCICESGKNNSDDMDVITECMQKHYKSLIQEEIQKTARSNITKPSDQDLFCQEKSEGNKAYRSCVCDGASSESLSSRKALCLAQQEGLVVKNVDPESSLSSWIDYTGAPNKDTMEQMCEFWENDFYDIEGLDKHFTNYLDNYKKGMNQTIDFLKGRNLSAEDLKSIQSVSDETTIDFDKIKKRYGTSFVDSCKENPYAFFDIEKKIIPERIESVEYKNGRVYNLTVSNVYAQEQRTDESSRSDIGAGLSGHLPLGVATFNLLTASATKGLQVGASDSLNARIGIADAQSIVLAVNDLAVDITTDRYKRCTIIKPRMVNIKDENISTSEYTYRSMGLMLCSPTREDKQKMQEHYYYVHQFFGGHSHEFMSRTIYINRPFVLFTRGEGRMQFFIRLLRAKIHDVDGKNLNLFDKESAPSPDQKGIKYSQEAFRVMSTDYIGNYNGIYTEYVPIPDNVRLIRSQDQGTGVIRLINRIFNGRDNQ